MDCKEYDRARARHDIINLSGTDCKSAGGYHLTTDSIGLSAVRIIISGDIKL